MDYLFIEKCKTELEKELQKERIFSVHADSKSFSLKFRKGFLNIYAGQPNALFFSDFGIAKEKNSRFKALEGTFVKFVKLPVIDRVIEIETVKILPSGKTETYYLILELTGKNANVFLLDGERKIISMLRKVKSSVRPLEKNDTYTFPPQEKKEFHQLQFGEVTRDGIEKNFHKFVAGISPLNAKEIARLFEKLGSLEKAYEEFLKKHQLSNSAYLYYEEDKPKYMTTFLYQSFEGLRFKEFSGKLPYTECWKTYYLEKVEREELKSLKRKLLKDLEKRVEALKKELQSLKGREELLKEAEENRKLGELLKYNLNLIKPGVKNVKVFDYYTNQEVEISLDPKLSPQKNVEKYFSKYRKLKRKVEHEETLRKKLEEELLELEFLKETINAKETLEELQDLIPEEKKKEKKKKSFKIYTLPSGRKIIVGRSSKENEFLSMKLANPWDIWFHAKEIPGSHVILKLNREEKPSDEDILLSAAAAAFFSKGKQSGKVPVDYTEAKNLKKPKGTPPGFVIYENERTIIVNPDLFSPLAKESEKS